MLGVAPSGFPSSGAVRRTAEHRAAGNLRSCISVLPPSSDRCDDLLFVSNDLRAIAVEVTLQGRWPIVSSTICSWSMSSNLSSIHGRGWQ